MAPEQVAGSRTIIRNPANDDPNAGIIVAAGDPIPIGAGIVSNTPNKVDAAANYEIADAADQASTPRPADRIIEDPATAEARARTAEIVERVSENRQAWGDEQRESFAAAPVDAADAGLQPPTGASATEVDSTGDTGDDTGTSAEQMTVAELDATYGDADGYPKSGNKADKVAFVNSTQGGAT